MKPLFIHLTEGRGNQPGHLFNSMSVSSLIFNVTHNTLKVMTDTFNDSSEEEFTVTDHTQQKMLRDLKSRMRLVSVNSTRGISLEGTKGQCGMLIETESSAGRLIIVVMPRGLQNVKVDQNNVDIAYMGGNANVTVPGKNIDDQVRLLENVAIPYRD